MRPRKEILDDINPKYPNVTVIDLLLLEVLMDIRDLLIKDTIKEAYDICKCGHRLSGHVEWSGDTGCGGGGGCGCSQYVQLKNQ